MHRSVVIAAVLVLVACTGARAQQAQTGQSGQVGVAIISPATIGLVVHVSDVLAWRPEFGFTRSTSSYSTPTGGYSSTNTTVNFGLGALFYVRSWEEVRLYASPRFTYSRNTFGTTVRPTYGGSGSIGAQYVFKRRLGAFGEAGINYTHQRQASPGGATANVNAAWSSRAVVGVVVYLTGTGR